MQPLKILQNKKDEDKKEEDQEVMAVAQAGLAPVVLRVDFPLSVPLLYGNQRYFHGVDPFLEESGSLERVGRCRSCLNHLLLVPLQKGQGSCEPTHLAPFLPGLCVFGSYACRSWPCSALESDQVASHTSTANRPQPKRYGCFCTLEGSACVSPNGGSLLVDVSGNQEETNNCRVPRKNVVLLRD